MDSFSNLIQNYSFVATLNLAHLNHGTGHPKIMESVPDLLAYSPTERQLKLTTLLYDDECNYLPALLGQGMDTHDEVLQIIMPLDRPLDALVITMTPIEEQFQHPVTSWLGVQCVHSGRVWQ